MKLPKLYNPGAAAIWALLLPCFFGPVIHGLNWSQLGEKKKARNAWLWAVSFVICILFLPGFAILLLFAIWYYASGQHQVLLWKSMPVTDYEKKRLTKPVLFMFFVVAVVFIVAFVSYQPAPGIM